MSGIYITSYSAICNLGDSIEQIFQTALLGQNNMLTDCSDMVKGKIFPLGKIFTRLPEINNDKYNLRCNRILLHCVNQIKNDIDNLIKKYPKNKIGVVIGNTNSGVDEFEKSGDIDHSQIGNPAGFLHKYLNLEGYYSGVSTACTSGVKAFSTAKKLLESGICDAVVCGAVDSLCKMPVYGFHSLEVLSDEKSIPFSKNRKGINIGEGGALFILEKSSNSPIVEIKGIGETSDAYHSATPDPDGTQASIAIKNALVDANISVDDVDYINLHGTGTLSNDLMEANAVFNVFKNKVFASSTKALTGHCLGAAAAIESALCCAMLDKKYNPQSYLLPHCYDGGYDDSLPKINLVERNQKKEKLKNCVNNAFGFGGSNAVVVLGSVE